MSSFLPLPGPWLDLARQVAAGNARFRALLEAVESASSVAGPAVDLACLLAMGQPRQTRALLEQADPVARATTLACVLEGAIEARIGDLSVAVELLGDAIHRGRIDAEERLLAWALEEGGRAAGIRGEKIRSLQWLEEGLEIARRLDVKVLEALLLAGLGMLHGQEGRSEAYASYTEQALAVAREVGDEQGVALALCNLAGAWCSLGRLEESAWAYEEALALAEARGLRRIEALVHAGRGGLLFARGEVEAATRAYARSEALLLELGDSFQVTRQVMLAGQSLHQLGRFAEAAETFARGIRMAREHAYGNLEALALRDQAECLLRTGRAEEAHEAFRACIRLQRVDLEHQVHAVKLAAQRSQATLLAIKEASWERERRVAAEASNRALAASLAEQEALRRELERASRTDALTGLANRRAFDEQLRGALAHAARYGRPTSLALIDVDHFKSVNDTHGHDVGDQVLAGLALRAAGEVRSTDLLARWGGEEFVVLLPETDSAGALAFAEKLLRAVRGAPFRTRVGPLPLTASVGVATLPPGATGGADLLRWADDALYAAKRGGRDRAVAWTGSEGVEPG